MSYDYKQQRQRIFTEEGHRDKTHLKVAGAARMQEIMNGSGGGDTWDMLACVDRLVELGEIREVTMNGDVAGQDRVFVKT
jgi:hypothetical protein